MHLQRLYIPGIVECSLAVSTPLHPLTSIAVAQWELGVVSLLDVPDVFSLPVLVTQTVTSVILHTLYILTYMYSR